MSLPRLSPSVRAPRLTKYGLGRPLFSVKGLSGLGGNLRAPPLMRTSRNTLSILPLETRPRRSILNLSLWMLSLMVP